MLFIQREGAGSKNALSQYFMVKPNTSAKMSNGRLGYEAWSRLGDALARGNLRRFPRPLAARHLHVTALHVDISRPLVPIGRDYSKWSQ